MNSRAADPSVRRRVRGASGAVEGRELLPGLRAQGRVEVGQRLVHEEGLGLPDEGAADGHALALTAGELLGQAVEQVIDLQGGGDLLDPDVHLRRRVLRPAVLVGLGEREAEVPADGQVRAERVALEHHGDVALLGRHVGDVAAVEVDGAQGRLEQPGEHAEEDRLPAAGGPEEDAEVAVGDLQVDGVHGLRALEGTGEARDGNGAHVSPRVSGPRRIREPYGRFLHGSVFTGNVNTWRPGDEHGPRPR